VRLTADDLGLTNDAPVTNWTDSADNRQFTGNAKFNANYANGHGWIMNRIFLREAEGLAMDQAVQTE
jgi:hypothetical protein